MSYSINDTVKWVGKIDWELRHFHGEELSTQRGSSYNSYLVQAGKNVLIDTVWAPFAKEFVANLAQEIDLNKIDYIIANHGEVDHSGALPELMQQIPDTPIYCTENCIKSLKGQYHQDWNFVPVKTGDVLDLGGGQTITFVEMKMLHWPDSMLSYLSGDNIVFSNDAFGQHYASEMLYNDLVDQSELYYEAMKYYANILMPFSKLVENKLKELSALNLDIKMICPSHGILWRENPGQIVETYAKWCNNYQEDQITLIYDSMWHGTKHLTDAIMAGIRDTSPETLVKLVYIARADKNDAITEVFKSKGIIVGSPTVNKGILSTVAGFLSLVHEMGFKGKKAAGFGCYGWSGESPKIISESLSAAGFEIVLDPLKALWDPDAAALEAAYQFGKQFALSFK